MGGLADLSDALMLAVASLDCMLVASALVRYPCAWRKSTFARVCETRWEMKAESDIGQAELWSKTTGVIDNF